jgi:lysophospholipase L1-like esterase
VWPGHPASGSPGEGRRVLILGDSLTRESRVQTARLLRSRGWTPTFRCWGSKRLDWGLQQVARARQLDQLPGVVVIGLGTNDISWETTATTERRVRTLLDRLGPRREVLWIDLDVDHSAFTRSRAGWFNRFIRSIAATRPNVSVIEWEKAARSRGAWRRDGIHYGESGYRLRAQVVAEAVDRAAPRPSPESTPSPIPSAPVESAPASADPTG